MPNGDLRLLQNVMISEILEEGDIGPFLDAVDRLKDDPFHLQSVFEAIEIAVDYSEPGSEYALRSIETWKKLANHIEDRNPTIVFRRLCGILADENHETAMYHAAIDAWPIYYALQHELDAEEAMRWAIYVAKNFSYGEYSEEHENQKEKAFTSMLYHDAVPYIDNLAEGNVEMGLSLARDGLVYVSEDVDAVRDMVRTILKHTPRVEPVSSYLAISHNA